MPRKITGTSPVSGAGAPALAAVRNAAPGPLNTDANAPWDSFYHFRTKNLACCPMATKYYPVEPNFHSQLPSSLLALLDIGPAYSVGGSLDLSYPAWVIYTPGARFVGSYGMNKFLFRTRFESDLTYVPPLEWSRGVDIFSLAGKANIPVMLDSSWAEGGPSSAYVPPPETTYSIPWLSARGATMVS